MAERKPRPLSEIEIHVLDIEEPPPNQPESSEVATDGIHRLIPPSLQELEAFCLPSLEELHLEHAYTCLHSPIVKNRKERKKHFEMTNRRNSYGGTTESAKQKEYDVMTESEKSRQERKKHVERHKRRRSSGGTTEGAKHKEYDMMTESEKSRHERRKSFDKQQRRKSYGDTTDGTKQREYDVMIESEKSRQERKRFFERQQRRKSYHGTTEGTKQKEYDVMIESEKIMQELQRRYGGGKGLDTLDPYMALQTESGISRRGHKEGLEKPGRLKVSTGSSSENEEYNIGRKNTLTLVNG